MCGTGDGGRDAQVASRGLCVCVCAVSRTPRTGPPPLTMAFAAPGIGDGHE